MRGGATACEEVPHGVVSDKTTECEGVSPVVMSGSRVGCTPPYPVSQPGAQVGLSSALNNPGDCRLRMAGLWAAFRLPEGRQDPSYQDARAHVQEATPCVLHH